MGTKPAHPPVHGRRSVRTAPALALVLVVIAVLAPAAGAADPGDGEFEFVQGVAVDSSGNVYVADWGNSRIQKFDSSGAFLTKWGSYGTGNGQFNSPGGIVTDSSGNVYVADTGNSRVQKFDSAGNFLTKWGSFGTGDGEFMGPGGIGTDASGNVYVAEYYSHRIQKFDSSGTFLTKWGSYGSVETRPDALIRKGSGAWAGDGTYANHYDITGTTQTRTARLAPGTKQAFLVKVENDGYTTGTFRLKGCSTDPGFAVKYFSGGTPITSAVTGGTYEMTDLAFGAFEKVKVLIRVKSGTTVGEVKRCRVKATATAGSAKWDAVFAKVKVV